MATLHPYLGISKQAGYETKRINQYRDKSIRRFFMNVNKKTEKDILKWMEANKPYQTAIKRLIREQIKREKAANKAKTMKK